MARRPWWIGLLLDVLLRAHGQVFVMSPDNLVSRFSASGIPGATSTFGAPFYGDRVLGRLIYKKPGKQLYCTEDDYDYNPPPASTFGEGKVKLIDIVLLRRGEPCTIANKVKIASKKGAHAAIVVDKEDSKLTSSDMHKVMVKDDGTGSDIRIPSILIAKEDGQALINTLEDSRVEVVVELKWMIPTDHIVRAELWMNSASKESMYFLKEFASNRRALGKVLAFQPHYSMFSIEGHDHDTISKLCVVDESAGQRTCSEDPDGPGPLTGKDVVLENLRQMCIHMLYQQQDSGDVKVADQYWKYVERFADACPLDKFGLECSKKLMTEVGIDVSRVTQCAENEQSTKLKEEMAHRAWGPRALRINGWRYSGALHADLVTRAICSGFVEAPKECGDLLKPRDPTKAYAPEGQGVSFGQFFWWLLVTVLIAFVLLLLYKRYMEKDMRSTLREEVMLEVQSAMSQYSQMPGR